MLSMKNENVFKDLRNRKLEVNGEKKADLTVNATHYAAIANT